MIRIILIFIALYRKISAHTPKACRYYPSCSSYAEEAIKRYSYKGIVISLIRILKCNQFFKGGYDPVK